MTHLNKTLPYASRQARLYSIKYLTSWFVRKMPNGDFEAYAHDSNNSDTVLAFYCGEPSPYWEPLA